MPKEGVHAEQIVAKLRQIEVLLSQGKSIAQPAGTPDLGAELLSLAQGVWRT